MIKLKEYLIGDCMYHKAKDVDGIIEKMKDKNESLEKLNKEISTELFNVNYKLSEIQKELKIAVLKATYCERNHRFCPDCRDKIGSEEGCPRCRIQELQEAFKRSNRFMGPGKEHLRGYFSDDPFGKEKVTK